MKPDKCECAFQLIFIKIKTLIVLYKKNRFFFLYKNAVKIKNDSKYKLHKTIIEKSNNIIDSLLELDSYEAIQSSVTFFGTKSIVIKETYLTYELCDFAIDIFFDYRYMIENFNKELNKEAIKFYSNTEEYIDYINLLMPSYLKTELNKNIDILKKEIFENIDYFSNKYWNNNEKMIKSYLLNHFSEKTKDNVDIRLIINKLSFLYILQKLENENFDILQKKKVVALSNKNKLNLCGFLKKYNSKKYNFILYATRREEC